VNIEQSRVHAGCHGSGDEKGFSEGLTLENPLSQRGEREEVHLQQEAFFLGLHYYYDHRKLRPPNLGEGGKCDSRLKDAPV
jgi:hypothetical protein